MQIDRFYLINLFDFYSSLLTEKQQLHFTLYYFEDQSLSEIAEYCQVSRTAIQLSIKNTSDELIKYEKKLKLFEKSNERLKYYKQIKDSNLQKILFNLEGKEFKDEK